MEATVIESISEDHGNLNIAKSNPLLVSSPSFRRKVKISVAVACILGLVIFTIVMLTGIVDLNESEQLLLIESDGRYVENGPKITWVRPGIHYEIRKVQFLLQMQYTIITDLKTGTKRVQKGPGRFFLGAYESGNEDGENAVSLGPREYLHVNDILTGEVRMVRGPQLVFPLNAHEEMGDKRRATQLASYEAVVVREANGSFTYHQGSLENTELFLEYGCEIVQFRWSAGADLETNASHVIVEKIDTRIRQLPFWFDDIRSRDNMEFELEGVIFWQVVDIPKLIRSTGDPTSDIWHHLRARLAEASTSHSFQGFLENASSVKDAVIAAELANNTFYSSRGVKLHSMDLIEVELHSDDLAKVITDQIAAATTKRINSVEEATTQIQLELTRLQGEHQNALLNATHEAVLQATRQNSSHQLMMAELASQKLFEVQRLEVLDLKEATSRKEASSAGAVAGLQLAKVLDEYLLTLNETLPSLSDRVSLYRMQQEIQSRNTTTANLASGRAQLIVTPDNMHLNLGILHNRTEL